jgi:hypothetical protein
MRAVSTSFPPLLLLLLLFFLSWIENNMTTKSAKPEYALNRAESNVPYSHQNPPSLAFDLQIQFYSIQPNLSLSPSPLFSQYMNLVFFFFNAGF